jgi:histone H3/H4
MAAKKKAAGRRASGGSDAMIISKSRVKAAAKRSNVGSEFYGALEQHVRQVISTAEARAAANGRKTLRPQDV